jgi:glycosyltransferase involved in cell wall biosynthesis
VILGYGPEEAQLRAEIVARDLTHAIQVRGFEPYDRLPAYFGLAGGFVHPASSEPWGLVVNEAMASGLPVLVSSTAGSADDLVQHGVTGFKFDPRNSGQLAQLMALVSIGDRLRDEVAAAARRHIQAWSPERFARNLIRIAHRSFAAGRTSPGLFSRACLHGLRRRAS